MIEEVTWNGQILCYIIATKEFNPEKTTFLTPPECNVQVGYIVYPAGHQIPPHAHRAIEHVVDSSEVLLVRRGRCEVDIYNGEKQLVATRELQEGNLLIMVTGGHGFRMLEYTVLLEVKPGPYKGSDGKERI